MPVCISHELFFFRWERMMERQGRYMYYFEKGKGNHVPFARHTERREGEMVDPMCQTEPLGGGPRGYFFVQKNF